MNRLEKMFGQCVGELGGEVLAPFNTAKCADFLFRLDDVVVEMKTLEKEALAEHRRDLQALMDSWMRRGMLVVMGQRRIELQKLKPALQREWLDLLEPPVENLLRDANRQIRSTKEHLGLTTAKGVLLIANEGNRLHTSPRDYLILVSRMLSKKTQAGKARFPHIQSVIYFSETIPTSSAGLPFWAPGQLDQDDQTLHRFTDKLRDGWFAYLSRVKGVPITVVQRPG